MMGERLYTIIEPFKDILSQIQKDLYDEYKSYADHSDIKGMVLLKALEDLDLD